MITIIRDYLTRRGYTPPDVDWYKQISLYQGWYEGYVDSFHRYQVFNGTGFTGRHRRSLRMAKVIAEDEETPEGENAGVQAVTDPQQTSDAATE